MAAFTAIWKRINFNHSRNFYVNQETLDVIESDQLKRWGVEIGDFIYAVSRSDIGQLLLIGKMQIGRFASSPQEVEKILKLNYEQYSGEVERPAIKRYAIAKQATLMQFDTVVEYRVAQSLQFITQKELTSLKFDDGTEQLNKQTLRTMRRLTPKAVTTLDKYLKSTMNQVVWFA